MRGIRLPPLRGLPQATGSAGGPDFIRPWATENQDLTEHEFDGFTRRPGRDPEAPLLEDSVRAAAAPQWS